METLRPVHVLFDLNLRPGLFDPESVAEGLEVATIVKMNDDEWDVRATTISFSIVAAGLKRL